MMKPAKFRFPQNLSSRTDVFSVYFHSSRTIKSRGKPSNLWTFEATLLEQRFPVEYKLDVFIQPLTEKLLCLTFVMSTATLRHSAISLFLNLWEIIILLSPTAIGLRLSLTTSFLSFFCDKTFAMTVVMQISHRHVAALFHLYSVYLF